MVLYFTGTGNSRFIARKLGGLLDDSICSIGDDLRNGRTGHFTQESTLVFVVPTYMSRMPPKVEKYIQDSDFLGCGCAYFVFSAAQAVGNAEKYCKRLCDKKNLIYMGTAAVKSPANYVVMYDVLPKNKAEQEMERSIPAIEKLADQIRHHAKIELDDSFGGHKPFSAFAPAIVKMASAKGFHVSDACISCGSCERACPLEMFPSGMGSPCGVRNVRTAWAASPSARKRQSITAKRHKTGTVITSLDGSDHSGSESQTVKEV